MKTAIIITGNVATGKTALATFILRHYPHFQHVVIDDVRMKVSERNGHRPFTHAMERECQKVVEDMIKMHPFIIYETVGYGEFSRRMIQLVEDEFDTGMVTRFHLDLPLSEVKLRMCERAMISGYVPHPDKRNMVEYSGLVHDYFLLVNEKGNVLDARLPVEAHLAKITSVMR